MTVGQRIAQKRKELGLSQEGLGEQLGVSRQAIYKWESDASLPEIDKLITLSKIFSVSVGWLLGVEEEPAPSEAPSGELTEQQLAMVQEIVDRYLAAQPKPLSKAHRRLFKWAVALGALCLAVCLFNLFSKLDQVTQDYNNLRYSVDGVSRNVNSQISSITGRVEDILKSQNNLTAEWSTQVASTDPAAGTVTFDVRAVPKTYVEGMTAIFIARSGDETAELPVKPAADGTFSGQLTCPLTDQIDVSVVLVTGDKRETQRLDDFYNLYSNTFPELYLETFFWSDVQDDVLLANDDSSDPVIVTDSNTGDRKLTGMDIRVGLFRDRKLVCWYEKRDTEIMRYSPNSMSGTRKTGTGWYRTQDVILEPGHEYHEAAIYTDEYGRQRIYSGNGMVYEDKSWVHSAAPYVDGLTDWEF